MSYVQKLYLGPAEVTNSDFNLGNTSTIISRDPINSTDVTNKKYVDDQNTIIYNLLNGISDTISDLSLNKQNVIDTNNKLPITNVDLTGSALSFIDITEPLQQQLTDINTTITDINTTITDISNNTNISELNTQITNLQTGKQNTIDNNNKISSDNVSYNFSDVKTELDSINLSLLSKAPQADPTFTGTVSGITKSMVGLGNVDNTSDDNKPVSTVQQSALNLKANLSGATFTGVINTDSQINLTSTNKIKYATGTNGHILGSDATGLLSLQSAPSSVSFSYISANIVDNSIQNITNGTHNSFASINLTPGTWLLVGRLGTTFNSTTPNINFYKTGFSTAAGLTADTCNIYHVAEYGNNVDAYFKTTTNNAKPFPLMEINYTTTTNVTVHLLFIFAYQLSLNTTQITRSTTRSGGIFFALKIA